MPSSYFGYINHRRILEKISTNELLSPTPHPIQRYTRNVERKHWLFMNVLKIGLSLEILCTFYAYNSSQRCI